jgi:hypothetical protein
MHSPKEKEKKIMHGGYQIALQESGQKECYAGSNINFRVFFFGPRAINPLSFHQVVTLTLRYSSTQYFFFIHV